MDCVGALGPDPCPLDRHAPFYFHLKMRALNGDRDKLTDEEREFVRSNGWHEPETTAYDPEISDALIDVPAGLDFLA